MTHKLILTLTRDDGLVLDKWTSDDFDDEMIFKHLSNMDAVAETTGDRIRDAIQKTYWVKDCRTYLIKAESEDHALRIFNHADFDDDWSNHDVDAGFEI